MNGFVGGSPDAQALVELRGDEVAHPLARADDDFVVRAARLAQPADRESGFGLAVFREEGGIDDNPGCCAF